MTAQLVSFFAIQPVWGRLADRIGNKRILTIGGYGVVVTPLLLLLADHYTAHLTSPGGGLAAFMAVQAFDGIVWSAYSIAASNYLLDIVTPPKRARCTAYFTLFFVLGMAGGVTLGGLIAHYAPVPLQLGPWQVGHVFPLLLLTSAILRVLPNVLLLNSFKEYRLGAALTPHPAPQSS
jgi:MFS family permease